MMLRTTCGVNAFVAAGFALLVTFTSFKSSGSSDSSMEVEDRLGELSAERYPGG